MLKHELYIPSIAPLARLYVIATQKHTPKTSIILKIQIAKALTRDNLLSD